jgi:hypothetical protein
MSDAIAAKVRALLAKTEENGCTEAEALSAAEMARKLMDAHRLTQSDVEIVAEPIDDILLDRPTITDRNVPIDFCMIGLERYCGVKTWRERRRWPDGRVAMKCRMLGLKPDVQMASYLYQLINTALASDAKRAAGAFQGDVRRTYIQSFQFGMAQRISARLTEMAHALEPVAKTSDGTSLVVVKQSAINDAFAALGMQLRTSRTRARAINHGAYRAGQSAADGLNLGRPVGGQSQRQIR